MEELTEPCRAFARLRAVVSDSSVNEGRVEKAKAEVEKRFNIEKERIIASIDDYRQGLQARLTVEIVGTSKEPLVGMVEYFLQLLGNIIIFKKEIRYGHVEKKNT